MSLLLRKQRGLVVNGITRLATISLIASFSFAFIDTIWSVYIDSLVDPIVLFGITISDISIVGFFSAFLTLISFISFFFFIPFIERTDKSKIYSTSLILFSLSYFLFAINTKFYFFVIIAVLLTIIQTFRITSFGIMVRDNSQNTSLSKNEGLMYTFTNVAWLFGPLIAGFISEKYGLSIIFILSSIFILLAFFLFKISNIKDANIKKKADTHLVKNFLDFFRDKNRTIAYILGGGVNFWWSLIFLYVPLLIIKQGLDIIWVGYFLFGISLPTILFEYYFSKLAGKVGFRKMFNLGFLIPSVIAFICFFIPNIYIILSLLILASIGLSMIEPTTEAYFFDITTKKEESRFYGPYNTAIDINHFTARILSAALLIFLPFKFVFLFFSLAMFLFFLLSFKTKNIIEQNCK